MTEMKMERNFILKRIDHGEEKEIEIEILNTNRRRDSQIKSNNPQTILQM
jgi:hypothetical protein